MSRFYRINIGSGKYIITNQVNGKLDPGALRVEIDVQAAQYATPTGQSTVVIWGVPLNPQGGFPGVSQASDLNNLPVVVSGGMQSGLPLATNDAPQAGVLVLGQIFQAYGNWMGVAQSIGLVITPSDGVTQAAPADIVVNWKKGQKLGDVLNQTLSTAYPQLKLNINVSDKLVLTADEMACYDTIQQLAPYIQNVSQKIIGGDYPGVNLWIGNGVINVFDGTTQSNPKAINFIDMIGQPTWLGAATISFSTVMRGDLGIGDVIKLPELSGQQSITTPQSQSQARNKASFQGTWTITQARHVGDSRAPSAMSWISVFQAISNTASPAVTSSLATAA
jgi:hypothetical protein